MSNHGLGLLGGKSHLRDFPEVLKEVQEYIAKNYAKILKEKPEENRELLKSYIKQYVDRQRIEVEDTDTERLIELLYGEMTGYSFLSLYLHRDDIEEINVNSWDDVKITYSNGETVTAKEKFNSPTHAVDVFRRMLQKNGMIFDNAQPVVVGHLSNKIRITVMNDGVIDKGCGVSASIRIVNPRKLSADDFVKSGTATAEMLEFISTCYNSGVSMCVTGATSSGKTTLMMWVLSKLPYHKRLITLEQNVREFDLVVRDEDGNVRTNVVQMRTRFSDDPKMNIDLSRLVETSLTLTPTHIVVAEMKGGEAYAAIEVANTGHTVLTTTHANSCYETYNRMITLSMLKSSLDKNSLAEAATKAFPIVVFAKKLADKSRRIMEITECERVENGIPILRTLYRFKITDTKEVDGKPKIIGFYEKVNNPTDKLLSQLKENGMSLKVQDRLFG